MRITGLSESLSILLVPIERGVTGAAHAHEQFGTAVWVGRPRVLVA